MGNSQPTFELSPSSDILDTLFTIIGVEDSLSIVEESDHLGSYNRDWPWILSIDDDECIATALEVRLQQVGVNLVRAASGLDGLRVVAFEAPQLILLDYQLPKENGDIVLEKLKASPATAGIPVICLTGHKDNRTERQMRNLGAAAYLTKPYNWQHLWQSIQSSLCVGA